MLFDAYSNNAKKGVSLDLYNAFIHNFNNNLVQLYLLIKKKSEAMYCKIKLPRGHATSHFYFFSLQQKNTNVNGCDVL